MADRVINTRRLRLLYLLPQHLPFIHALLILPETSLYNTAPVPASMASTQMLIEEWLKENENKTAHVWSVYLAEEDSFIGQITLRLGKPGYKKAEVSYKIMPVYWSKGYTTEALKAVIDFGLNTLGLHRIEAGCAVANTASVRVMEKAGMIREGISRRNLPLVTGWADNYSYAILDEDLNKQHNG